MCRPLRNFCATVTIKKNNFTIRWTYTVVYIKCYINWVNFRPVTLKTNEGVNTFHLVSVDEHSMNPLAVTHQSQNMDSLEFRYWLEVSLTVVYETHIDQRLFLESRVVCG